MLRVGCPKTGLDFRRFGLKVILWLWPAMEVQGLAAEWDQDPCIRSKVRAGGNLLDSSGGEEATNKSAMMNVGALTPALTRFVAAALKLPDIKSLRNEILELYTNNQQQRTLDEVDDEAWTFRSLLRFVKRKTNKRLVSKDARL